MTEKEPMIVIEGPDGAGKTSMCKTITNIVKNVYDKDCITINFPNQEGFAYFTIKNILTGKMKVPVDFLQTLMMLNMKDTFKRKTFLNSLNEITPLPGEAAVFEQMKDMALYLPTSGSSENAFIVKYANRSHAETAKRLLRASVATIEHIKPESLGGSNSLDNFVLASASANSYRSNMPLNKYINRFPDIPANCQKYINKLLKLMNAGALKGFETYPYKIKKCLFNESKGLIKIKITKE